ncbi:MAG TPA: mercuric reductase [Myxococcaceae bacterium]|nr:mercuric reductase [Myxococcaceae bacterium]
MRTWDALVVGAGQAGVPLAVALARAGRRTAMVERAHVGGTCINVGCTPTKTLVASARVAALTARAAEYGIEVSPPRTRWAAVRDREQGVVHQFRAGGERRLREAGVTLLRGEARFVGPRRLRVTGPEGTVEEHEAPVVALNTGGRPRRPELPGLDSVPALDSSSILTLGPFPERLLVLGGGYIALELGQVFRRLGAEVSIVESAPRLASREDEEISDALAELLRAEGIRVHLGARPTRVSPASGGVRLELADGTALEGTHLLVAVGRTPNTDALDCAAGGVALDAHGFIRVDERLRTSAEGVYATGDVTGAPQFTHVSYDDYRVLRAELLDGPPRSPVGRLVPYTLFTDPQLGRVGLTEAEARARGLPIRVARMPMSSVARAIESGETRGVLRAVVDTRTERILGFAALGFEGGELATVVHTAMLGNLTWPVLKDAVFPHPGLAESLNNLFDSWL